MNNVQSTKDKEANSKKEMQEKQQIKEEYTRKASNVEKGQMSPRNSLERLASYFKKGINQLPEAEEKDEI